MAQATATSAQFVEKFADAWAKPTPERLVKLLDDNVRLVAPMTRTTIGIDQARAEFGRLLELLPDLHGEVHRWSETDDALFIDMSLSATVGNRTLRWQLVDRFRLQDGLATERISYFDPTPVITAFMRHPKLWPRLARNGLQLLRSPR